MSQEVFLINIHDVGKVPPHKYCFLIGQTLVMSLPYETHIGDLITLCFLVLKCLHQFSCSSYQKQGSPSIINDFCTIQIYKYQPVMKMKSCIFCTVAHGSSSLANLGHFLWDFFHICIRDLKTSYRT